MFGFNFSKSDSDSSSSSRPSTAEEKMKQFEYAMAMFLNQLPDEYKTNTTDARGNVSSQFNWPKVELAPFESVGQYFSVPSYVTNSAVGDLLKNYTSNKG